MKFKTLDKLWKEILFALTGFGPGFLMVVMGAYLTDAINPTLLKENAASMAINYPVIFILPAVFPILIMIAKIVDGVIDIPLANMLDNLKPKRIGKTKLPIIIGFIPMVLAYCMTWTMVSNNQTFMTVWVVFWAVVFFICYSNNLLSFYGSISSVCVDSNQRLRVSSFKAFFDTISYCLCYALVPVIVNNSFHIGMLAVCATPLMLTLLIPLFLLKEGPKFEKKCLEQGYELPTKTNAEPIKLFKSIGIVGKNKSFMMWMAVNSCSFFGLQMFLVGMVGLIRTGMGFSATGMTILNVCAFAPVPLMLYFFQKIRNGKGVRFAYRVALITFAACIMSFFFGSTFFLGTNNVTLQYIIGCLGGISGSFAIGAFMLMPTMLPAQLGAHEQTLTGKNQSAMFYAVQAVITTVVGAISSALIYEYTKMLFISKSTFSVVWAENFTEAAQKLGAVPSDVFNFGLLIIPFIVSLFCIIGFIIARWMPRNFTLREIAVQNKLTDVLDKNPELEIVDENRTKKIDDFGVNIALFVLTGGLFGLVWRFNLMSKLGFKLWWFVLSIFCPPLFIYIAYKMGKQLNFSNGKCILLAVLAFTMIGNLIVYILADRTLYRQNTPVQESNKVTA